AEVLKSVGFTAIPQKDFGGLDRRGGIVIGDERGGEVQIEPLFGGQHLCGHLRPFRCRATPPGTNTSLKERKRPSALAQVREVELVGHLLVAPQERLERRQPLRELEEVALEHLEVKGPLEPE